MLLVLLIHYAPTRTLPTMTALQNDWIDTIMNLELRALSFVCVNCFIMISGYFGIKWKWRSFSNLIFQILFWGVVAYSVALWCGWHNHGFTEFVKEELGFVTGRWFIPAYITLYIIAPLLNSFVDQCSQKQLGKYIIIFYLFSTVYGYFMHSTEFNEGMSMISLIGIYLIGAYLRRYDLKLTTKTPLWDFGVYLLLGLILVGLNIGLIFSGISISPFGYLNPIIILQSGFLFLCFKKLNIGNLRVVNYIASSAFAVYLFHIHPCVYGRYQAICHWINDEVEFTFLAVIVLFLSIFAFCVIIDKLRIGIFNLMYQRIGN